MATPTLTPNSREEQDERYDPVHLSALERQKLAGIEDNYDKSADDSQENNAINTAKNINNAHEQEQMPPSQAAPSDSFTYNETEKGGQKTTWDKIKGFSKKAGPAGGIGALLFGGAGLGLFFLSPGLLLVQMKEVFTNYGSSSSRAAIPRYNKMLQYTIGNDKVDSACNSKPTGVKCRLGTMSDGQKKAYEKAGFKINGTDYNGRTRVTDVEFPDGHKSTSGSDFTRHTKRSIKAASAANRAHNPATKVFNGVRFATNVLKNKFGQNKANEKIDGDTDEERKKDFNNRTGESMSDSERESRFRNQYEERIRGSTNKTTRAIAALGVACSAYNISRTTIAAVKIANGVRFVSFAMRFLKVADQIKNEGDIDPETVAFLGTVLTSTAIAGTKKAGLSATDSQGYKVAAYGGEGALKDFTQAFLLGGNPFLVRLDDSVRYVQNMAGGKNAVRAACRAGNDPLLFLPIMAAMCLASGAGGAVAGTIVPGAGNIAGAITAAGLCVLAQLFAGYVIGEAIKIMVKWALPIAVNMLANSNLDVNKISGVDAGNAMAVGAGVMLGTTALSRGLKAGNKSEVTKFLAATAEDQTQADQIAMYDAKNEPFNVYNQYSFLGSTLRKTGIMLRAPTSLGEGISNLGTIVKSSLGSFSTTYASPASMPVNVTDADMSACPDRDMTDIGIACDKMGNPYFVLSPEELAMDVGLNLDFMVGRDEDPTTGYIDDEGNPLDTDKGKLYQKWLTNCTENREAPMGATMMAIEEDDYDWGTGENCVGTKGDGAATEEELSNFRVYYNTLGEKEDGDYSPTTTSTSTDGAKFNVATFNILHADDPATWHSRLKDTVGVLTSHNIDIAGLQEARPKQQTALKTSEYGGDVYDMWPSKDGDEADPDVNPDSVVIWNKEKFELVSGRQKRIKYDGNRKVNIVKLKYIENGADGPELYVLNTHDPIDKRADSEGGPRDRKDNDEMYLDTIKNELTDAPVVFTGDFNAKMTVEASGNKPLGGLRENLAYCILTRDNILWHVSDAQQGKTGQCPSDRAVNGGNRIDHIFISTSMKASGYGIAVGGKASDGSDHDMLYSTVEIPGASTGEISKDGWAWPLPANESKPGPCYGGDSVHAGVDINTDGSGHVFAMHDGIVVKVIDGVTGTSPPTGNHIMIKTPEGIYYGYQHLLPWKMRVKEGDQVKAGDFIAIAGKTGNVQASSKAHLHITTATTNTTGSYGNLGTTFDPMSVLKDIKPSNYSCY